MTRALRIPHENISEFCRRWKVTEMTTNRYALDQGGDLGFFLRFEPQSEWNLADRIRMHKELQSLSGRDVRIHGRFDATRPNSVGHVIFEA